MNGFTGSNLISNQHLNISIKKILFILQNAKFLKLLTVNFVFKFISIT